MNLDIWAFVRIMVALEDREQSADYSTIYECWAQEWMEVDQELARLADVDFDAYSQMMMQTQISLDLPKGLAAAFGTLVQELIEEMKAKRAASGDPEFQKNLKFEIDGLQSVLAA